MFPALTPCPSPASGRGEAKSPVGCCARWQAAILGTCVALATLISAAQGVAEAIASCGFEPSGNSLIIESQFGGGQFNTDRGAGDSPQYQRIRSGNRSWLINATHSTLNFKELFLSGWSSATVTCHVSSTAIGGSNGNYSLDYVSAQVATTNYAGQAPLAVCQAGDIAATCHGDGTTWGYDTKATLQINVPNNCRAMKLTLYAQNEYSTACWNLDDLSIEGVRTTGSDYWWDGDGIGAVDGGGGNWNNSTAAWASEAGGSHSTWNSTKGDNAHFTQSGGVVKISTGTTVAARSLTFAADGYTIAPQNPLFASALVLTDGGSGGPGPNTIDVTDPTHTATIAATIAGNASAGLIKTGAGTLVLGGVNTYAGPTIVRAGTLRLSSASALAGSSRLSVGSGATLDLTPLAEGFQFGGSTTQALTGNGTILGHLRIAADGIHDVGESPDVQRLQGNYTMNGLLKIEVSGPSPGNGDLGYDQLWITGPEAHDVVLDGELAVLWSGAGWSSANDRLWIIHNDTAGTTIGAFRGYADGDLVGNHDGRQWRIYYNVDADPISGRVVAGNDVMVTSSPIPEPSSLGLGIVSLLMLGIARRRWLRIKRGVTPV
jgi:autotransporter-associated beta strand protein